MLRANGSTIPVTLKISAVDTNQGNEAAGEDTSGAPGAPGVPGGAPDAGAKGAARTRNVVEVTIAALDAALGRMRVELRVSQEGVVIALAAPAHKDAFSFAPEVG